MTGLLDFRFYCACVRIHVSTNKRDAKILGLSVLMRMSGGTLYPRGPCCPFLLLDKGNEDSGNEIEFLPVMLLGMRTRHDAPTVIKSDLLIIIQIREFCYSFD